MTFKNSQVEFGFVAKGFHWIIAFIILGLIPVGFFMGGMENSPLKFEVYAMHKSFGLLVFFLGLGRIVWRFISLPPPVLPTHQRWEHVLASMAHVWLYICMIALPLTGWLMSSAGEFPVPFFGIQMPPLIGKNEALGELFYDLHEAFAYSILVILALHMAGALKHHVLDRDETLKRMTYQKAGIGLAAALIFIAGLSYVMSGYAMLRGDGDEQEIESSSETPVSSMEGQEGLDTDGWIIDQAESSLTFSATMYGAAFEGTFKDFEGTIQFDPENLDAGSGIIRVVMANVMTGDKDRDSNIGGSAFFDSAAHPESILKIDRFTASNMGAGYDAHGTLTIKGVTVPVILPFTIEINDQIAVAKGEITLNRLDFEIGTGEWSEDKTIGHSVTVSFSVKAKQS